MKLPLNFKEIWFSKLFYRKVEVFDYELSEFPIDTRWLPICVVVYKNRDYEEYTGDKAKEVWKSYKEYERNHSNERKASNKRRRISSTSTNRSDR